MKRILSQKYTEGRICYEVRWRGYGATENIWLTNEDLANSLDLLQAYQLMHGKYLIWLAFDFWCLLDFQGHSLHFASPPV